jgi:hypothetical protein
VAGGTAFLDSALAVGFAGAVLALIASTGARNPLNAMLRRGPLAFYGRISYGLYMIHIMVFIFFGWFDLRMDRYGMAGNLAVVAFRLAASTALATALWYGFESQILKLKRYFSERNAVGAKEAVKLRFQRQSNLPWPASINDEDGQKKQRHRGRGRLFAAQVIDCRQRSSPKQDRRQPAGQADARDLRGAIMSEATKQRPSEPGVAGQDGRLLAGRQLSFRRPDLPERQSAAGASAYPGRREAAPAGPLGHHAGAQLSLCALEPPDPRART